VTGPAFDEVVHAPQRLRTMALLAAVAGQVEFATIRDVLDVADSVLSKHLKVLHDAGYIELRKPTGQGRVRTWVQLTPAGQQAYTAHVAALREIVARTTEAI
jgi:DNA-binding MarR family transcriptional regulator